MPRLKPLPSKALARRTNAAALKFKTTSDLQPLEETFGQERAVEAVRFGIGIRQEGYNLFALGPSGTGKHRIVRDFLERQATGEEVPSDWCYVHNFKDSYKPHAIRLPPGRGQPLRTDLEQLIEELRVAIPATFESEEFRTRRQAIEEQLKQRHEAAFGGLQKRAQAKGVGLIRTPMGVALAPMRDGEVLNPEEFNQRDQPEQERIKADIETLQGELQEILEQVPRWEREQRAQARDLSREVMRYAVAHLIVELKRRYADLPAVIEQIEVVQEDIIEHAQDFLRPETAGMPGPMPGGGPGPAGQMGHESPSFTKYEVNVLVDHSAQAGAPVVYEDHPSFGNLLGRIEHQAQFGALVTNFTLIKAGALHRANNGYLILDARKLLLEPLAWEELKRVLRSQEIRIDAPAQAVSLVSTVTLQPEPIPLNVKIVLVGERLLYHLLSSNDPEFRELFKVPVDFDDRVPRNADYVTQYARYIATLAQNLGVRPLDKGAVARIMDRAARLVEDGERLSTHAESLCNLIHEADYWAGQQRRRVVRAKDVQQAVSAQIRRSDRIRERMLEEIHRDTILIDTQGERTGQINGLSVLRLGNFAFGKPSRITVSVGLGRGELVDIEREVALGGPLHSKGVLILSGFLSERFAGSRPLSLKASLVFEQSYGGIDGDSASSAELYGLISALAEAPINQGLAVTGSVNQHGEVQAIGGVNEKIEGFFDVCNARGLSGHQGVLIPAANAKHLMLRNDVIAAAESGKFHIYAVKTIDQGIEILTGIPAGRRNRKDEWASGSINQRVEARLAALASAARRFARPERKQEQMEDRS